MEQTIFLSISQDEIFRIAKKENILYSEYSNINDLKELDIFKNYKNLKEMLSYFILVYSIYTNGISIVVVADHNTV
ncbi:MULTISPECIES: hypothetical protein [Staphylococcus]|uniref:hypothetical protein n=1 Tax=Staphylococcus TaxID=1279 RepID=UPI0012B17B31|nr:MULTISPECIES: hypothetical protein [Staphylococcus]HCG2514160.1 hypothetical protein [Staphylococcus aureus]MBW5904651.1 hypothetical protein [Staphylococcus haemolyticus]NUI79428.1 hypothetical protein [Staphylococcus borealis]HCG2858470.1 hypothetical protein [Staphylococcus aureus]HDD6351452.1 hypothetical protein [Staphylococcus aureus]